MAIDYHYQANVPNGEIDVYYSEIYSYDEEYKESPVVSYNYYAVGVNWLTSPYINARCSEVSVSTSAVYDNRAGLSLESIARNGTISIYAEPGLGSGYSVFTSEEGTSPSLDQPYEYNTYTGGQLPVDVLPPGDYRIEANSVNISFSTNFPIFETDAELSAYIANGTGINDAINSNIPREKEGEAFDIRCIWTYGTWSEYGFTPPSNQQTGHRDVMGNIISGKVALYPIPNIVDGALKYGVKSNATFDALIYSEDGVVWHDTSTFPYSFFYKPRTDELGTFRFALTFWTNRIPIFEDEETAQGFLDDDVPITDALNWDDISGEYPDEEQTTGDPDDGTDWGNVFTKSYFHNQYMLEDGGLQEISNALYDVDSGGTWENIKKGLEMYGQNPMDAVMSLMFYPLNLTSVFTYFSDSSSVYFGGYRFALQSHTAKKIVYPDGYFYCGGVSFIPKFKNWRDTKATRIFVDLPYCGRYELDPAKYWGKHVNVVYYIDTHTGGCVACLVEGASTATRQGKCLDQYNGQIGVNCPITLTDFSAYANAQINTLLGNGGQAVNNGLNVGESGARALASGMGGTAVAGLVGAGATAGALGAIQGAKTVYGLAMNNINKFNQTRGGSTGMLNQYANQRPTFIFVYPETDNPANFNALYGMPSNYGGTVSSFVGYLEVDTIKLNMPGATESEKEKARALLMGGIYIN